MEIIESNQFVMIDNRLISRNVPPHALSEKEFKRLLHLWAVVNIKFGNTYNGRQSFNNIVSCSKKEYDNVMGRLEQMHFIETEVKSSKVTYTTTKMMPLYDSEQRQFIRIIDLVKTKAGYLTTREHFTMIPKEALLKSLKLSVQDIKLLLKLYKYNNLELFNGIDPNAVVFSKHKGWYINPRIPYDLYMDEDDFFLSFNNLLENGFLTLTDATLFTEKFDFETRFRLSHNTASPDFKILVPVYQFKERSLNEIR